jgi:hypothetical protein
MLILQLSGWDFDDDHKHDSLPGLTWASEDDRLPLSQSITNFLESPLSDAVLDTQWDSVDGGLLSQLSSVDFRYWWPVYIYGIILLCGLVSYFPRRSSFSGDRFLGPFYGTCTFRTVQPDGPQTIRVFQPCDRERCFQTHEIPSQNCKLVIMTCCCALNSLLGRTRKRMDPGIFFYWAWCQVGNCLDNRVTHFGHTGYTFPSFR